MRKIGEILATRKDSCQMSVDREKEIGNRNQSHYFWMY